MNSIELLRTISKDLNIDIWDDEDREHWSQRVLYSGLGKTALTALFDQTEDSSSSRIAKVHLTNRVKRIGSALIELNSDFAYFEDGVLEFYNDEIYSCYLKTGYLYHSRYGVQACREKQAKISDIYFIRSAVVDVESSMSGLGLYSLSAGDMETVSDLFELFQIERTPLERSYSDLIKSITWEHGPFPDNTEFLNVSGNGFEGYWSRRSDKTGRVGLLRYGDFTKSYALYKIEGEMTRISYLPPWRYEDGAYFTIANALLKGYNTLPPIRFHREGQHIRLRLGYLLPPEEESLLCLYSWPVEMNCKEVTFDYRVHRDIIAEVFFPIKKMLEMKGYSFTEV